MKRRWTKLREWLAEAPPKRETAPDVCLLPNEPHIYPTTAFLEPPFSVAAERAAHVGG
jgi:hypothetical protein